jgi:hypothetical protein
MQQKSSKQAENLLGYQQNNVNGVNGALTPPDPH